MFIISAGFLHDSGSSCPRKFWAGC